MGKVLADRVTGFPIGHRLNPWDRLLESCLSLSLGQDFTAPMIKRKHQLLGSVFLFKTGSK